MAIFLKSSQADSSLGPVDVPGDIQGWTVNTPDTSGQLKAERYGTAPHLHAHLPREGRGGQHQGLPGYGEGTQGG
jgi:hypothetical protein